MVNDYIILSNFLIDQPIKTDSFNDRVPDKSLEEALNTDLEEGKEINNQKDSNEDTESEVSDEGYETELEEIYTAYTCQFIRDETYN